MEENSFFEEEIRNDYRITSKSKRVWAVQLAMLDQVERICKKYKILYFADSGTLIGAVRDHGYIPWDDDIDLVMLRKDYERFVNVAPMELPSHLKLQTVYTEKNYLRAHAQLRDGRTTGYNEEDRKAGYNCGIFIDIMPLDGMPDDRFRRKWWMWEIKTAWTVLYTWYRFDYYDNKTAAGYLLHAVGKVLNIPMRTAYGVYENICRRYSEKDTKNICDTVFLKYLKAPEWRREWFDQAVYMPFENRQIPVPAGFDGRLRAEYGDYMKPVKAPTTHGDLVLDPDISYRDCMQPPNAGESMADT